MSSADWDDGAAPALLFLELWRLALAWGSTVRARSIWPDAAFAASARSIVLADKGKAVSEGLRAVLPSTLSSDEDRGKLLEVMCVIDEQYLLIHPRSPLIHPSLGARPSIAHWLKNQRERRAILGSYATHLGERVIPRGPLVRSCRQEHAANADYLPDYFSSMSVAPEYIDEGGRKIEILTVVIGADVVRGVPPGHSRGRERVVFLPIAEKRDELVLTLKQRGQRKFMRAELATSVSASERIIKSLAMAKMCDIAIAPENVVPPAEEHALSARISSLDEPPRLTVAGSGLTDQLENGQPWNESGVMNGLGAILWRQRKVWPAGLSRDRAIDYGLPDPGPDLLLEDTAAGTQVIVADVDTLGRCVVLVCQDLEAEPLASDLIRHYQPDWVFAPVLDRGVVVGRWAHQRTFALSARSQARFVVASSTALAEAINATSCGLAVGPRDPADIEDAARAVARATFDPTVSPAFAVIEWRDPDWEQTVLDIA